MGTARIFGCPIVSSRQFYLGPAARASRSESAAVVVTRRGRTPPSLLLRAARDCRRSQHADGLVTVRDCRRSQHADGLVTGGARFADARSMRTVWSPCAIADARSMRDGLVTGGARFADARSMRDGLAANRLIGEGARIRRIQSDRSFRALMESYFGPGLRPRSSVQ